MRHSSTSAKTHVVVAGAGIAGMTAAMLLAETGFRVTLIEAAAEAGGKAKSLRRPDGQPTEHSLRIYLDHYQTLLTLLARIPAADGSMVLDNLVGISAIRITDQGVIGHPALPVALKRTKQQSLFKRLAKRVFDLIQQLIRIPIRSAMVIVGLGRRGVGIRDVISYIYSHFRLLWMCRERLSEELGNMSYADYLGLSRRSPQAQAFFSALPRIFVAARPDAEAAAIAPVILKALFHFTSCPRAIRDLQLASTMMMNGPTSERMIDPWIRHLENLGVEIHFNTQVHDLDFQDRRIASVITSDGRNFACDYAILALPYLTLRRLTENDRVRTYLPHLALPHCIQLESSNGLQCYLRDIPPSWPSYVRPGILTSYLESEWSLISVVQGEGLWTKVKLPEGTKYVLSMTWSEVEKRGCVFNKLLSECTPEEILIECLAQCGLDQSSVVAWQVDHELKYTNEVDYEAAVNSLPPHLAFEPVRGERLLNFSPLTILMPGARNRSPRICTELPNLMLAGETAYSPDLTLFVPTMEKAASSGYLAAREIVRQAMPQAVQQIQIDFKDPFPFAFLRRLDRWLWNRRRSPRPIEPIGLPDVSNLGRVVL